MLQRSSMLTNGRVRLSGGHGPGLIVLKTATDSRRGLSLDGLT